MTNLDRIANDARHISIAKLDDGTYGALVQYGDDHNDAHGYGFDAVASVAVEKAAANAEAMRRQGSEAA